MDIVAIIAGAGSGTRLGADKPKALVKLAGEALIVHAVRGMQEAGVDRIVVTIPADSPSAAEGFSAALASVDIGDSSRISFSRYSCSEKFLPMCHTCACA